MIGSWILLWGDVDHPTNLIIKFWEFVAFKYMFDSPQVKQDSISSVIDFSYKLPCELLHGLFLRSKKTKNNY